MSVTSLSCRSIVGPMKEVIGLVPRILDRQPLSNIFGGSYTSYVCTLPDKTDKKSCEDYNGTNLNPVRPINPGEGGEPFYVYCEDDGGVVIQRRTDLSIDFNRSWNDYYHGFGDLHGDHWLGLKKIARIRYNNLPICLIKVLFDNDEYANGTCRCLLNESLQWSAHHGCSDHYTGRLKYQLRARRNEPFYAPGGTLTNISSSLAHGRQCADTCGGGWWYTPERCRGNINGILTDMGNDCESWPKTVVKTWMKLIPSND
ncbi:angiopoietin-related protein 4-like [Lytechinus variegatus]|uniref:angiopoietin-related protein 4-like n=1 Tax=Lytechinus variegatus TaxID=7654 RepID=UPI001BB0F9B2|nr:angiopoietin-related protein 4-like [Lytechinus variegatus]